MKTFALAVGLGLYPALAGALNYAIVQDACIGDVKPVPPFPLAPIPVGCELVDCCPGCPGPGPIEWRIRFDSKLKTRAELRFEGLPNGQIDKLEISGAAKRDGERILLRPGTARLGGIPTDRSAPVAVGMLQVVPDEQGTRGVPPRGLTDRILVEQFMGPFLVNRFIWTWVPGPCIKPPKPPGIAEDRLKIDAIAEGDDVKVMLDGRSISDGCRDGGTGTVERTFSSTGVTPLGNMLSPGTSCRSEVAVFSKKHAMKLAPLTWTDYPGDLRTVTLEPPINAALNVWITDEAYRTEAEEAAQKVQDLFLENRVGVRLGWTVQNVAAVAGAPPNAVQIVNAGVADDLFADCLDLASIQAQPFYVANTLNVYYLNKPWTGRNCAIKVVPGTCITSPSGPFVKADANITFIGRDSNPTTLAHELGHAYGIRPAVCSGAHVGPPDFGADNIMFPSGSTSTVPRTTLKLGQVFRMNIHSDGWGGSMMLQNNATGRTPRSCFPHLFSAACPLTKLPWPP